jgi:hypothetical protein
MVTSPNMTLTLESVPVQMSGSAGGALQTGQRIGAAVGTAVLAAIFYATLSRTGRDYQLAISAALLGSCGFALLSLTAAVAELVWRHSRGAPPQPARLEHAAHPLWTLPGTPGVCSAAAVRRGPAGKTDLMGAIALTTILARVGTVIGFDL